MVDNMESPGMVQRYCWNMGTPGQNPRPLRTDPQEPPTGRRCLMGSMILWDRHRFLKLNRISRSNIDLRDTVAERKLQKCFQKISESYYLTASEEENGRHHIFRCRGIQLVLLWECVN